MAKIASAHTGLYTLITIKKTKNPRKKVITISVTSILISSPEFSKDIVPKLTERLGDIAFRNSDYFKKYK